MKTSQRGSTTLTVVISVLVLILIGTGIYLFTQAPAQNNVVVNANTNATTTPNNTATTTNNNTNTSTSTPSTGMVSNVKIYLYAPDDKGAQGPKFGCDDSLVFANVAITPTQAPLKAAIEKLLSLKKSAYGESGFNTALYQSNLKVDSATIVNGVANVKLSGQLMLGGVCDSPRIQAQLENTAKQFASVNSVNITINGKKLADHLSEK